MYPEKSPLDIVLDFVVGRWAVLVGFILALVSFGLPSLSLPDQLHPILLVTQILALIVGLGLVFATPVLALIYRPVNVNVAKRHIQGRLRGGVYEPLEALYFYRQAWELLLAEDSRIQSAGTKPSTEYRVELQDLKGIILQDESSAYQMLSDHESAFSKAHDSRRLYEGLRNQFGIDKEVLANLGKGRAYATLTSASYYSGRCDALTNSASQENPAKVFLVKTLELASPQDPFLSASFSYGEQPHLPDIGVSDYYGASKAHCQYSWCFLPEAPPMATWHAEMARQYAERIKLSGDPWGKRDGLPLGRIWRLLVANFTLGDCWVLQNNLPRAYTHYRMPYDVTKVTWNVARLARRVVRSREFYMGHWFWLFLLKYDVPYPVYGFRSIYPFRWLLIAENGRAFNSKQAFKWLIRSRSLASKGNYYLRLTLSELHLGDYWFLTTNEFSRAEAHWRVALNLSVQHQLPHYERQAAARLDQSINVRDIYEAH